ncbi:MAG TPA: FAD:protein FMN transferase [Microbacteriaceae bacterium]|nr:FAD:protein FMN transferase [Microbacteriaceae bacterium]
MGSAVSVTLVGGSEDLAERCLDLMDELEGLWSRFRVSSELSRLSRGECFEPDPRTRDLLEQMRAGFELTGGAFDPTLLREIIAIGYDHSLDSDARSVRPGGSERRTTLSELQFGSHEVRLPPGMAIDPGGIGKGAAADLVADFALYSGADGVLVDMGGDIAVRGAAPDGQAWRIAVEDPFVTGQHIDQLRLQAGAVATSSQLGRRFTALGGTQSHLLNPATGRSVDSDAVAVTVVAGAAWFAEVCTKPGFVWTIPDYLDWLPRVGAAGLVAHRDGTLHRSANWENYR